MEHIGEAAARVLEDCAAKARKASKKIQDPDRDMSSRPVGGREGGSRMRPPCKHANDNCGQVVGHRDSWCDNQSPYPDRLPATDADTIANDLRSQFRVGYVRGTDE